MINDPFLCQLSEGLKSQGVDAATMVLDLDRLDANIEAIQRHADPALNWRLVAKSLPCFPLLQYVQRALSINSYMTFSEPMMAALLRADVEADHLVGRPFLVSAARRILSEFIGDAPRIQWLVDSETRVAEYSALAQDLGVRLRLSFEVDVGLHRGGFDPASVHEAMEQAQSLPGLEVSGVMCYEAHLPKLPALLKTSASAACEARMHQAASSVREGCINAGGSLTFDRYRECGDVNDISFGSILVQPTDFVSKSLSDFQPALFIATPVLKVMNNNPIPGLEFLPGRWAKKRDIAIQGGYFKGCPVFPPGAAYSKIFGRSSNQEVWACPADWRGEPGDIALLHPSQSESVLSQFGSVTAVRDGKIIDVWPCLPG
jgi:D-serine deaminase-like pyridoxal phosphate-dependent protein